MHKKVHGSYKYILLTYTYSILSRFKATFRILPPFLPSSRPVWEGSRSLLWRHSKLSCLLAGFFTYLLACLLPCLVGWLLAAWLIGWLVSLLDAWFAGCLLARLLARSLASLLACRLAFFGLLCLLILICLAWLTCEARDIYIHRMLHYNSLEYVRGAGIIN